VKQWRAGRADGSAPMVELAEAMNAALGNVIDAQTSKIVRRRGRFVSTRDFR
jgi:hypothetical protein